MASRHVSVVQLENPPVQTRVSKPLSQIGELLTSDFPTLCTLGILSKRRCCKAKAPKLWRKLQTHLGQAIQYLVLTLVATQLQNIEDAGGESLVDCHERMRRKELRIPRGSRIPRGYFKSQDLQSQLQCHPHCTCPVASQTATYAACPLTVSWAKVVGYGED